MESLVPVEAVVTTKGDESIIHSHRSSKELDAVVEVGHDFHVVNGGSRAHTGKG